MNFRMLLLTTLIPAAVAVIGFFSFITYREFSEDFLKQEQESLKLIARKTVMELDMWLDAQVHEVGICSEIDLFKDACTGKRLEEAQRKLDTLKKSFPMYENIFLADTVTGKVFLDAAEGKTVGFDFSKEPAGRPHFEAALRGEIHIGEAFASPADGSPTVGITAPVYSEGKCVGMIGEAIRLSYFSEIFIDSFKIGKTGYMYMVDAKGDILAHHKKEYILKTNIGEHDFGKEIMGKKKGSILYEWKKMKLFGAFDHSGRTGWIVNVGLSFDELLEPLRSVRNLSLIFGIVFILVFWAVIWSVSAYLFKIINRSVEEVKERSDQMMIAAGEMSVHSQSLAEGASEQAASIEETSSHLEEMSAMIRQNADNAVNADKEMKRAMLMLEDAGSAVSELTAAMREIHASGEESSRIVSTINDIAFQTNLLSLNAAVEATRAGKAGAGFAVVAGEVRNLAMKTREAAENTSAIIRNTGNKITGGVERLSKTNQTFDLLKGSIQNSAERFSRIAGTSDEQARGIDQVNTAVIQVDRIVQKNAANAHQSASVSEEMHGQVEKIGKSVAKLMKLVKGSKQSRGS